MNKFENEIQFQFVHVLCIVTLILKNIPTHHSLLFFWIDCKMWRWFSYLFILKLRLFHLSYLSPISLILWLRLRLPITSTYTQVWGPRKSSPLPRQEHPYLAGAEVGCMGSLSVRKGRISIAFRKAAVAGPVQIRDLWKWSHFYRLPSLHSTFCSLIH